MNRKERRKQGVKNKGERNELHMGDQKEKSVFRWDLEW